MAPYGIAVTMQTQWHGAAEQFSNVFHYDAGAGINTEAGWISLGDAVVAAIRPLFSNTVTFVQFRVFGPTNGTKAENQMRAVKDLSGLGSLSTGQSMPPEMAIVCKAYIGRGPAGGKQFLRKFFHLCRLPGGSGGPEEAYGITSLNAAIKAPVANAMNSLKTVTVGGQDNDLCTPNGKHIPLGTNFTTSDYVSTRQFRRGRKERGG